MKEWKDSQSEVSKVKRDSEMARSILKMVRVRIRANERLEGDDFASLKLESYYEIIKEIITALMALDGYKTLSHEVLIGYLREFHSELHDDIYFIDNIRKLRHKISYKGFFINRDYLERDEWRIKEIIRKLEKMLVRKLED